MTIMEGGEQNPSTQRGRGLTGSAISRIDGPVKVQGKATFAAEFMLDGMVYAALVFSTVAKGRIATLDTGDAQVAPGVVLVMTHRNAPRMGPMPLLETSAGAAGTDNLPIMQDDRVYWNGQPVAVVLAETQEQADHATSLIRPTYEAELATTAFEQAKANGTKTGEFHGPLHLEIGEAEASLAAAAVSVDATYRTPRQNHNAIELHAATVAWDGDELMVHDASQSVTQTAWSLADIFGISAAQVRVTSPYVGGGFGGKLLLQHEVLAAAASKLAGRPVRMTLSREGVYRIVGGRARTEQRVAIGAGADGGFEALIHTGTVGMAEHAAQPEPFLDPSSRTYAADSFKLDVQVAYLDMVANSLMRAPGTAVGSFALESAVDELAAALDMDPIELRIRNEPDKDPTNGLWFSSRNLLEAWSVGAERFGWNRRRSTPRATQDGEWLVGLGCATALYRYARMPGGAARITLTGDGHARVEVAAHDMGMGTATVQTAVCAERLGLDLDEVTFAYGDSTLPGIVTAAGSQQTASINAAVGAAHRVLVSELLTLVGEDSPLAGLQPDDVSSVDGGLAKRDEPARHDSYAAILARAGRDEVAAEAKAPAPQEMMDWSIQSYGAMFCEVRVNAITGETRVTRFLASMDCGRILSAKTAASQFRGAIVMGLGFALMEETQFDERYGRIMNPSLAEYHLPVHMDVPEIDVIWTDIPDPQTPMGAHGIGEIGITGTSAAVANAIFNATGKRVRDVPITLDKLM